MSRDEGFLFNVPEQTDLEWQILPAGAEDGEI